MRITLGIACLTAVWLAGCAGRAPVPPAPVTERAAPVVVEKPMRGIAPLPSAPTEARSGVYTVKKGDTLHAIALEHGQDYKDIFAWNNLENPNRIHVGQQLRVVPPEEPVAVAVVKPVVLAAPTETKPVATVGLNTEALKREPKGGKVPYSEQALARLREAASMPERPAPAEKIAEPPTEKSVEKTAEKPAPQPAVAPEDGVEWTWPAAGKLMAGFSEGSAGKEASKGVDIGGRAGDPVVAAAAGKVTLVSNSLRGYGNLVVIKHNATLLSVYAHNSKILVKEGQGVARGQKIAEIGSTDADQPKLHFEIRRQGKPVDPVKYLPAKE